MSKVCTKCDREKPVGEFYTSSSTRGGYSYWCKECSRKTAMRHHYANRDKKNNQSKAWKAANPGYAAAYRKRIKAENPEKVFLQDRKSGLLKDYGLTIADYDHMFARQNGRCAICKQTQSSTLRGKPRMLSVDHDHSTGKIRGLLCNLCNRGIGALRDSPMLLSAAIEYLTHADSGLTCR
jgi:hypothetical protein